MELLLAAPQHIPHTELEGLLAFLGIAVVAAAAAALLVSKTVSLCVPKRERVVATEAAVAVAVVPLSACLPILAPQRLLEALAVMLAFILLAVVAAAADWRLLKTTAQHRIRGPLLVALAVLGQVALSSLLTSAKEV